MSTVTIGSPEPPTTVTSRRVRQARRPSAGLVFGGGIVAVVLLTAIFAPLISPYSPTAGNIADRLWNVGTNGHLLGTDDQGRDILSRLIWGARPTLISSIVPVLIVGAIGTALGVTAGMAGGRVRALVMRTLDVFYAFPAILLAIAIGAALGPGVKNAVVSLTVVLIAPVARVAESEVLRLRSHDFMEAARVSGARRTTIAVRHVLPNIAPPLIVYCTSLIGMAIVFAGGLAFLGLGVVPPHPDWGGMLNELQNDIFDRPVLSPVPPWRS
jgi:peptide/nickel transport system permease protein